ncbi:glycerophosphodiester phosphodiesterase [Nocardioides marmoriginsengisoli]|uniref:Glycerophosphodiester phosphodiesterase n=1 Tax=Nocardioides marmoriginsengisoli TaxID=661483 RepID=A0A3N0CQL3_9ACTN|nr:glycerophosphodiester phosphodiesterase [Nocardioides marmoriginsengisoli]RNL65748.1 glycerophosphodiester phosphodiesterase [Nocardioides marmoriginsengisoli]
MDRPTTGHAYLDDAVSSGGVIAMAHRGGARHPDLLGTENTAHAFRHAVGLGYRYLETDVHATRDGGLIAFHDDVLDRVTDQSGPVATASEATLRRARIGGAHAIPTMADLLDEFAHCRFNIDLKGDGAGNALADLLDATGAHDRVCVGSFSRARIQEFRRRTAGAVATSAAPVEVAAYLAAPTAEIARRLTGGRVAALQVPHRRGPLPVVTDALVRRAHRAGVQVHVWTIDERAEMEELLDLGVDGLITDRTDVLKDLLVTRGLWRDHP